MNTDGNGVLPAVPVLPTLSLVAHRVLPPIGIGEILALHPDQFGVQSTICSAIDVLKEQPMHCRCNRLARIIRLHGEGRDGGRQCGGGHAPGECKRNQASS
jgi:hypothetical protein